MELQCLSFSNMWLIASFLKPVPQIYLDKTSEFRFSTARAWMPMTNPKLEDMWKEIKALNDEDSKNLFGEI